MKYSLNLVVVFPQMRKMASPRGVYDLGEKRGGDGVWIFDSKSRPF